jgi:hypothetical protein
MGIEMMEISDFTAEEFIELLKAMPQNAPLFITYEGYYEGSGAPEEPYVDKKRRVVIGSVYAHY